MGLGGLFGSGGDYYKSFINERNDWMGQRGYQNPWTGLTGADAPEITPEMMSNINSQETKNQQLISDYGDYLGQIDPNKANQYQESMASHNANLANINKIGSTLAKGLIGSIAGAGALQGLGLGNMFGGPPAETISPMLGAPEPGFGGTSFFGPGGGYEAGLSADLGINPSIYNPFDMAGTSVNFNNNTNNTPPGSSKMSDFFKELFPSGQQGMNWAGIISSLGDLYSSNKTNNNMAGLASSLAGLYGPNSAYADQLRKELQRRDAAAGRRSQYGAREVELQARLAELASRNAPTLANMYTGMDKSQNNVVKSLLNLGNYSGAFKGLQGLLSGG